ncbi:hypothetical protein KUTeg_008301 [Tegillarca granosa]|uniref:F-box domain-containing protein n=1 Tax=Tegillarca granosa TaxID=220873 RepID=A0ABQ9FDM5_TEGGR|nr:hypothetical protein KUTeg_008301 [Tegillarca granosa]
MEAKQVFPTQLVILLGGATFFQTMETIHKLVFCSIICFRGLMVPGGIWHHQQSVHSKELLPVTAVKTLLRVISLVVPMSIQGQQCKYFGLRFKWQVLWESPNGPENAPRESRKFCPPLRKPEFPTNLIRLEFCHKCCHYYTELDCVLMYGTVPLRTSEPCLPNEAKPVTNPDFQVFMEELELQHVLFNDRKEGQHLEQSIKQMKDLSLKDKLSTKETEDISCHGDDISANGYFDLLPYEVIQLILSYLDLPSLCRTAITCSLLHKHCYDSLQYKEVNLQPYWTQVNIHTLDNLHSRCKYLQRLNLSWCDGTSSVLQNQNFRRFLEACGKLDLQSCRGVDSGGVNLLCKLQNLQWLNLYRTQVDKNSVIQLIKVSKNLQHLNLGSCSRIQSLDEIAVELGKNCNADLRSRTGFLVNLVENCPKLKKIFLTANRSICDEDLLAVAQYCKDLEQIDILGTRQVSKESVYKVLKNCTKLIFFDLSFCEKIDFETVNQWSIEFPNVDIKKSFQH